MKKVILIYPEGRKEGNYPNPKGYDYSLQLPISLLPIAFYLQRGGYEPVLFDARIEDYRKLSLKEVICVGISSMTGIQIANAIEITRHIRNVNSNIPIIWGGIHPTLLPEQTVSHNLVDIVVRGEGEATMLELVQHLDAGQPLRNVPGITYQENDYIVNNSDRDFIDLNELQYLPYELLDMEKYKNFILTNQFFLNTSRGCPYNCAFCYNMSFNRRKWRCQRSSLVVDQIERVINRFGVKKFYFGTEDNFFVDKLRVENICKSMIQRNIRIEWDACCRADCFAEYSDEFLKILKEGGCRALLFGGESGSPNILKKINKGVLPEELINASKRCKKFGIKPIFSFITGFPFETDCDIKMTYKVIDQIMANNDIAEVNGIFIFVPYPGNPLFEEAKRAGLKEPHTLEGWSQIQFSNVCNLPWLDSKKRVLLNTIFRISRFPFESKTPDFPKALKPNKESSFLRSIIMRFKKFVWLFYWISAKIRWRYKFFGLPMEWKLWDLYSRKKRIW